MRIGCVPELPLQHLQGFLGGLYSRRPELQVEVVYLPTAEQIRRLRTGQLDIGMIRRARELDGIDVEPLDPGEPLTAFLPVGHRLAGADAISAGALAADELVVTVAVAEHQCVATGASSTLDVVGDVASLVTARPLEPPEHLPDIALAWRVNPSRELQEIAAYARETARQLYAD